MISKETHSHGSREFNYASYLHSASDNSLFFGAHWHDEWEIIFVRDGKFRFYVDGTPFTLQKNQALLIDRYAVHTFSDFEAGETSSYQCFVFGLRFLCPDTESYIYRRYFSGLFTDSIDLTQLITGKTAQEQEILRKLKSLEEYSANAEEEALSIQIVLLSIFDCLFREKSYSVNPHTHTAQSERLKTALLYLNQEYRTPVSISGLAESLHISTDYFIRFFKSMTGFTPKQYLQNLRVQKAASLLYEEADLPISEATEKAGFDDVNYFCRCFKKVMGLTPTQYAKNAAEGRRRF